MQVRPAGLSDQSRRMRPPMPRQKDRVHDNGLVICAHLLVSAMLLYSTGRVNCVGLLDVTAASPADNDGTSQAY
jgi:hypothetical protein